MSNRSVFGSSRGPNVPRADAKNEAGGKAYTRDPKQALAQLACTGTFSGTYYADADTQLQEILALAQQAPADFLAKVAVYSRERGLMKDAPALLLAVLASRDGALMEHIAPTILDSGKMLRNFVQIMRSGQTGRKSLGSRPRRVVRKWLEVQTDERVFQASVGEKPSLADVLKMVHPKPATASRKALYAWMLGKPAEGLPEIVTAYEAYKAAPNDTPPSVPWLMLTGLPLTPGAWKGIARRATWTQTRMNLQTFQRHGVLDDPEIVGLLAARLRDPEEIRKARPFPYQLLMAYTMSEGLPMPLRLALQDAMEIATENVPAWAGRVAVGVDVSGSMSNAVTGTRKGSTSKVRCVDVAALIASCVLRKNAGAVVIPFDTAAYRCDLNPRDSVMTNAQKLAKYGGGGTACSLPLLALHEIKHPADLVLIVSDNESWADFHGGQGSPLAHAWSAFKAWQPQAKLVLMDLQPYTTTQHESRADVLNIGGFSDAIFDVIAAFASGNSSADRWVQEIEAVAL